MTIYEMSRIIHSMCNIAGGNLIRIEKQDSDSKFFDSQETESECTLYNHTFMSTKGNIIPSMHNIKDIFKLILVG